jgi:hypothetical protein
MKFTFLKIFLNLLLIFSSFFIKNAQAWSGYDYETKTEIDIGEGNLVREGSLIQFYDSKDDNFHSAKINFMQSSAGGVEINLIDLDTKKERNFVMY